MDHADTPAVPIAKLAFGIVLTPFVFLLLLLVPANSFRWLHAWLYLIPVMTFVILNVWSLLRYNPVLITRRMQLGRGTKTWDKVWAAVNAPAMLAMYVVAGLEHRCEPQVWSNTYWAGMLMFVAGALLLNWSMVVNPFFEKTVRIQTDNRQTVIRRGPYEFVRHPGYIGFAGWVLATPWLLNSTWAWLPTFLCVMALIVRTALEDRTLQRELAGYQDYAKEVRYRLIPYLW